MNTQLRIVRCNKRRRNDVDALVFAELDHLRETEQRLDTLLPLLAAEPRLRDQFLRELNDLQRRADRLDGFLGEHRETPLDASGGFGGLVA